MSLEYVNEYERSLDAAELAALSFGHINLEGIVSVHLAEVGHILLKEVLNALCAEESELTVLLDAVGFGYGDSGKVAVLITLSFLPSLRYWAKSPSKASCTILSIELAAPDSCTVYLPGGKSSSAEKSGST